MKRFQFLYSVPLLVLLSALSLVGCRDSIFDRSLPDLDDSQQTEVTTGEFFEATVSFSSTDLKVPTLKALDKAEENEIQTDKVKAYVFQSIGTSSTFLYEAKVTKVEPDANKDKAEGKITLLIKDSGDQLVKVFFVVNAAPSKVPAVGTTLEEFQKLFVFNQKDLWGAGELPMYAESQAVKISHSSGAVPPLQQEPIPFLRAVARVDVMLGAKSGEKFNETTTGLKTKSGQELKITSIKAFNVADKGYAMPLQANVENATTAPKVKATSLPVGLTKKSTPTSYLANSTGVDALMRTIYIPELNNTPHTPTTQDDGQNKPEKDQTNYLARPYLILGIKGAVEGDASKVTYFRVDYLKRTGEEAIATYEYLDILRNYRYMVNITSIEGPGFDDEEDAKKGPAANIMYNVLVWEESQMSNVRYDGQYMLGVSHEEITYDRVGGQFPIKVQTSWPEGFEVENLPSWLTYTIDPADGAKTDEKTVTFTAKQMTAEEITAGDRAQKITIKAGRMRWNVNVKQSKDIKYEIAIYEDAECTIPTNFIEINQYGIAYDENNPDKSIKNQKGQTLSAEEAVAYKYFYVKVMPQNAKVVKVLPVNSDNPFEVTYQEKLPGGIYKYKVTARDITENDIRFETFDATYKFAFSQVGVEDEVDSKGRPTAKISFLQKEYDALPYYEELLRNLLLDENDEDMYLMDGKEKAFYVKANTPYKVELVSVKDDQNQDVKAIQKVIGPESVSIPSLQGKAYGFLPVEDLNTPSIFHAVATFKLTSPFGYFPDRTFTIELVSAKKQPEANCYMIKIGARQGILIPVSRVNTAYDYYDKLLTHDKLETKANYKLPGDNPSEYDLHRLDNDDDIVAEIVWTDIHNTYSQDGSRSVGDDLSLSGLEHLSIYKSSDGQRYVHVDAGDIPGNVLIAIRSSKMQERPILWSWHIWIVDEYPVVRNVGYQNMLRVDLMSHLLGAEKEPTDAFQYANHTTFDTAYKVMGMQYQWGRKDPFPSYGLYAAKDFYKGDGTRFDFPRAAKGTRDNTGINDKTLVKASGATFTMKTSIENPQSIISHQSFWQYELFPFSNTKWFSDKWTFLYTWNKVTGDGSDPDLVGGKTVFDPSPYGFRIMSQEQAESLRYSYYWSDRHTPHLCSPFPGTIYDGYYFDSRSGGPQVIYGVAQGRKGSHAGRYLVNTARTAAGWAAGSNTDDTYRRSLTVSIRPVIDPEATDYKQYLPD